MTVEDPELLLPDSKPACMHCTAPLVYWAQQTCGEGQEKGRAMVLRLVYERDVNKDALRGCAERLRVAAAATKTHHCYFGDIMIAVSYSL